MRALFWLLLAVLLLTAAGCSKKDAEHGDSQSAVLQLFEKGKGLRLPEDMTRTLGVETVDVAEKSFERKINATVRVYQSGRGSVPGRATALLNAGDAPSLALGQTVTLRSSDGQSETITGQVARLDSQTTAIGQVEALIEFPDAAGRHPAGSSLLATFAAPEPKNGFAVPASAVLQGADAWFVYTVNGSHFVRTPVKPGVRSGGWVEIADGLYTGDQVVAKGGDAMWMIELCALKGGTPCCPVGKKAGRSGD